MRKKELQERYNISDETLRQRLKAMGIATTTRDIDDALVDAIIDPIMKELADKTLKPSDIGRRAKELQEAYTNDLIDEPDPIEFMVELQAIKIADSLMNSMEKFDAYFRQRLIHRITESPTFQGCMPTIDLESDGTEYKAPGLPYHEEPTDIHEEDIP